MPLRRCLFLSALLVTTVRILHATQDVTAVTTNTIPGAPSSAEGYTFNNDQRAVASFTTATNTYAISSLADNVFIRRNAVNNNQSSVWYVSSGVGTDLSGVHQSDYGQMLMTNNIFAGSDNTFANGTANTTGNIERIDFTWNAPITVNSSLAFAVFERGAVGVHDSFAIAAITAVDGSGNPTAFGSLLKISPGWGGATNPVADQPYRLFRYSNGDNITASVLNTETNTQGIGGIVINAIDLGLVLGQSIYGYALMAADVTATNSAQLLDWTNATYYPTTTDGTTGGGGIDLAAVNGIAFAIVPEPTYTAGLIALILVACFSYEKQRRRTRS
jgi:hypothetical protein